MFMQYHVEGNNPDNNWNLKPQSFDLGIEKVKRITAKKNI